MNSYPALTALLVKLLEVETELQVEESKFICDIHIEIPIPRFVTNLLK